MSLLNIEEPIKNIDMGNIEKKECLHKNNLVISISLTQKNNKHIIYLQKQTNTECNACINQHTIIEQYDPDDHNLAIKHFSNLITSYHQNGYQTLNKV